MIERVQVVFYLQFADDTLFFCKACRDEILGYKAVLRCFELVPRLRINLRKSTLIGIDVEEDLLIRICNARSRQQNIVRFGPLNWARTALL